MNHRTGLLTLKLGDHYYTLEFKENGYLAAELIQNLDTVYSDSNRQVGILKLLGYMFATSDVAPPRTSDVWVEVDLDQRILKTNSRLIRSAVKQESSGNQESSFSEYTLRNLYQVLDRLDFTVELYNR